ncbi:cytoplasmic protein [Paenibacillus sp. 1011MAR3C5]|uniref:TerD family protein n=1 Tax=Paenibacillus sp. 1011MAR3C5 TaxID=1675787 RepID=UPI000E6D5515|nr:TerD family protein [Paenibacillus sp. 1011MAR3C5]RJE86270.1 cytoplasmic protein [Paenibacillus sp. 1011MAR3C5]
MNIHTIYLRRANKLIVNRGENCCSLPPAYLATALNNIEQLGYTFSPALMQAVRILPVRQFEELYVQLLAELKVLTGAHVTYKPMYPDFPNQVMAVYEAELYLNAIYHDYTLDVPEYEASKRTPLLDITKLKMIDLGSEAEFYVMMSRLMQANTSISETDKADIEAVIEIAEQHKLSELLPEHIPFKENVGFITGALLKHDKADTALIGRYVKSATDVLRLAVAWSGGDVSLAETARFRKFKRSERRLLLGLLEQCYPITEEMLKYKQRWIRLGEILHPSEYKERYSRCQEAFDILRNNKPFTTFRGSVELALQYRDVWTSIDLLMQRPGEFARRLDHLLRISDDDREYVAAAFGEIAKQAATPVLLQVKTHFTHRHERIELRTFFPKGNAAKAVAIPHQLPGIDRGLCEGIVQICDQVLVERFSSLPPLGKTYIDRRLANCLVPFSQRSASKALRTIVRGSRLAMPEGDTIRFFSWWKEGDVSGKPTGRVDIDLSAVMYDTNWRYMEHISYTNLRSASMRAVHSGDIVAAPHGACEFIDLHIPSIVEQGGRYVIATLQSYTDQPYCDLPECFVGWMMRKKPGSGEIFEPSTVADKIDVTANTRIAIPVILDLVTRTVVWTDLSLTRHPGYHNNVEGNRNGIVIMGQAMCTLRKPNLHDLFTLHAIARGELVGNVNEADAVFSMDKGVTPFAVEEIMAEYLA